MAAAGAPDGPPGGPGKDLFGHKDDQLSKPKMRWTMKQDFALALFALGDRTVKPHELQYLANTFPEHPAVEEVEQRLNELRAKSEEMTQHMDRAAAQRDYQALADQMISRGYSSQDLHAAAGLMHAREAAADNELPADEMRETPESERSTIILDSVALGLTDSAATADAEVDGGTGEDDE